jgi:hypothetical protein
MLWRVIASTMYVHVYICLFEVPDTAHLLANVLYVPLHNRHKEVHHIILFPSAYESTLSPSR